MVKNLPAMQETCVQSLGQEDPLEKEMTTHYSILPGESHRQQSLGGYCPRDPEELDTTEQLTCTCSFYFHNTPKVLQTLIVLSSHFTYVKIKAQEVQKSA